MTRYHLWILAGLLVAGGAQAQSDQAQLVRPAGAADLSTHLARLAANPRDITALIGAGEAALDLDDPSAAAGFLSRAEAIQGSNGRVKAGLARVMLKMRNPAEALRLFDQATRLGFAESNILSDRGLARDMVGDQAGAQRDYQAALKVTPDNAELIRRYAASLGISGQIDASDHVLRPLLHKSDRAAWRYRAFILAMNNRQAEAKAIADQTLPAQLVAGLTPYMQKMPYLTAAQKAAAMHLGHFPATIGTKIVAVVPTPPAPGFAPAAVAPAPPPVQTAAASPSAAERRASRARQRAERRATVLARADTRRAQGRVSAASASAPSAALAAGQAAAPATPAEQAPVPSSPPSASTAAPADRLPAAARATAAAPTGPSIPAPSARTAMVQPIPGRAAPARPSSPGSAPSASSTPSPPPQAAVSPAPATPPVQHAAGPSAVQGPPAPGFDTLTPTRAPAPPTARDAASTAAQLNAITLAQAAARTSTPAAASSPPSSPSPPPPSSPVASAAAEPPPPPPRPQPSMEAARNLADIIRAIDVPESERRPTVAAVDLAEIEAMHAARRAERQAAEKAKAADRAKAAAAAKAKAEADAKARKEAEEKRVMAANPARSWLQIGIGANRGALPFTLKALQKKYADLAPQQAWVASWGRTNRLLVGPFPGFARARALEDKLKAQGADVFAWQSGAGEVVERLAGR
ncbi:MAG: tetratricopeptide repeat protein [Sphingobium sp.]